MIALLVRRRAGRPGFDSWQGQYFNLLHSLQTDYEAYPASYSMGTEDSFPRDKEVEA
jgi:hypothetical protein